MLQISDSLQPSATRLEQSFSDLADGIEGVIEYDIPCWQPASENEPQQLAYELARSGDVMQIGYGGQAHGGKTDLGLGLAGTVFPDSLILRREYPHLKAIIERGNKIYPSHYISGEKKSWRFDGHHISLGSVQYERNWETYQGQPRSFIFFDEAAQFTETIVRNIGGWLRTTDPNQHTLLLLGFNPPTEPEGEWIVQFFAPWIAPDYPGERAEPGEIRWFVNIAGQDIEVDNGDPIYNDGRNLYPVSRTFVPASRHDNPYTTLEYEQALSAMPEPIRTKMMEGDFTIGTEDNIWQVIPTLWILQAMERGRNTPKPDVTLRSVGVDVARGGKDNTAIAKLYGNWFAPLISYPGSVTVNGETAAKLVLDNVEVPEDETEDSVPIFVDVIGYGSSCFDVLHGMEEVSAYPINNGASAGKTTDKSGRYQFANIRALSYWTLREALDPANGQDICLPDDRRLRVELQSARYKIRSGKILIEPKEDIVKRIGISPDYADAVVMAWYGSLLSYTPEIREW